MEILETVTSNNDVWSVTFYYVLVLVFLIGFFWTYLQVFVKPLRKKKALKENIIYQHSEDIIEKSDIEYELKKKKKTSKTNNNNKKKTNNKINSKNKTTNKKTNDKKKMHLF